MDEWIVVEEFPDYEVSTWGRIRSRKTGRLLHPNPNQQGFLIVRLRKDGASFTRALHKLVAQAFLPLPPRGHSPWHIDGDRWNNRIENLKYRSRYFVYNWSQQQQRHEPLIEHPIVDMVSGQRWPDSRTASEELGILEQHIFWGTGDSYNRSVEGYHFSIA